MSPLLPDPLQIPIRELSQVGEARRNGAALAQKLGFDETRRGQLAIILTELANNLIRHAGNGELILRPLEQDGITGVETLAIDRGPGMINIGQAMTDGYSTGGTTGTGLGAVRRLSSEFDLFSLRQPRRGAGSVLLSRIWQSERQMSRPRGNVQTGVINLPNPGDTACGDTWGAFALPDGRWMAIVADGLGHGMMAAEASRQAVRLFAENIERIAAAPELFNLLHNGLRSTRGAAVSVVELTADGRELRFTGVGNVTGMIVPPGGPGKQAVCHNGTLGAQFRRAQTFPYPAAPGTLFICFSDGLATHWDLSEYPGLANRDPAVIAGVIYRDHRRTRDDVTVLVARVGGPKQT